ncbi:hypothetical protein Q8W71_02240 [Methylobacterium sp. NEAU 140]|uniref:hypothetical protein n=1 Tax=Methylobacterium sp. NEAU 140 TaxID=3064945 RepID=UPI002732B47B|nr:hypothetical protein [Methylobacterium sp. NEAU 140]MDP4021428.1 hypothetical protein [Methylobacterium sp. NEAU 140]
MVSSGPHDDEPELDLDAINGLLAEWAARSASESDALIERFEAMGYEVRGKSTEEIAAVLRRAPTRAARGG